LRSIQEWLDLYGESHQNPVNKKIHWFCVPAIMFSIVGLWWSIPHKEMPLIFFDIQLNWAILLTIFFSFYYIWLSLSLAVGMFFISLLFLIGNYFLDIVFNFSLWKISLIIFVVAWIGQFIGHKIEGKKPSFFEDIKFLLIGPVWLLSFIYNKLGIKY